MNKFVCLLFGIALFSKTHTQTYMFRGSADHDMGNQKANGEVFDSLAWKINSNSPIRSTPLIIRNKIVFGTTKGDIIVADNKTGAITWRKNLTSAINSSVASTDTHIFLSNNEPALYCISLSDGKQKWKTPLGKSKLYEWKYDYYYSSPVLFKSMLYAGSSDGNIYCINQSNGSVVWKFLTKGIVRATPSIKNEIVYVGDTEGYFYALNSLTGVLLWTFSTEGVSFKNEEEGFDRKAILSTAVIHGDRVIFGSRDGFLYCLDAANGKLIWKNDHVVSWVITTPCIVDSFVIAASSDGRFVQAVNFSSGKEIWRSKTDGPVWSSPIVTDNIVYAGSFNGTMYMLDLFTGKRFSSFHCMGKIFSSPVFDGHRIYFGSDDGNLYALAPRKRMKLDKSWSRYVFFQQGLNVYFRNGMDQRIKNYLQDDGYNVIDSVKLTQLFEKPTSNAVIVFATNYIPRQSLVGNSSSLLGKFLEAGNKVIVLGNSPLIYDLDSATRQVAGLNFAWLKAIGIEVPHNDLRLMKGTFASFPTKKGIELGLPAFWTANHSFRSDEVDICLGKDENGLCSSWVKKFGNSGQFIQLWVNQEADLELGFILKVAETVIK